MTTWRKSSRSESTTTQGDCVEVAQVIRIGERG
jgi:Domain of unknown function (DUF397)